MGDISVDTTLSLDHTFEVTAGQTYTYTILGEVSKKMYAEEVIVVAVPVSEMNRVLTYSSSWDAPEPGTSGGAGAQEWQPLPAVQLRLQTVTGLALDVVSSGLTGDSASSFGLSLSGDKLDLAGASGSSCQTLLKHFQSLAFSYGTDNLSQIPVEAIERVQKSAVDALPLSAVILDIAVTPAAGETGPKSDDLQAAVQALFEQAVDAGMVKKDSDPTSVSARTDLAGETGTFDSSVFSLGNYQGPSAEPEAAVYGVQWAVGQSLGIYVRYDLTKAREYNLSTETNPNSGSSSSVIYFGGVTFDASTTDNEVSSVVSKSYQIVLKAVADPE